MNKTAIKNFAIWARVNLIESAKQKAFEYEITEDGQNNSSLDIIAGRVLSNTEKKQRTQLITEIKNKGFNQVMEEAAYTWFNRFIALRYMEVNGFLPSKIRVFSDEDGKFNPAILSEAMTVEIDGLDREKVLELIDKQDNDALYKMLIIAQCNALSSGLPYMFEKIENWTELLFPPNLLKVDSIIGQMVTEIPEEDWQDAVQIIGWLYQYYNTELKDETFALLKKNVKITKERIPAATQLFTPEWIVRYMVENSLGRLWYEGHENDALKQTWKYYLDEVRQDDKTEEDLKAIKEEYRKMKPEDIKLIDPCMGSGHILVYAFDVLMQIYTSEGWSERDAAESIVKNNIYGLDIDNRAGQLAYFAVMMKARKYNRRILNGNVVPQVMAIQDSSELDNDLLEFIANGNMKMQMELIHIKRLLADAKEYGSALIIPKLDSKNIFKRIDEISNTEYSDIISCIHAQNTMSEFLPLLKQIQVMSQKYDVCITNPPYMGGSGMSAKLGEYVKKNYPDSKSDMFAVFIERCSQMLNNNAYQAMITQHAWMFIGSYEKLREKIYKNSVINLVHLGIRAFEEIGNDIVQTCAFVIRNNRVDGYTSKFVRLVDCKNFKQKEEEFLAGNYQNVCQCNRLKQIPGMPFAYWVNDEFISNFEKCVSIERYGKFTGSQNITGNNDKYLRYFWEVSAGNINDRWYFYAKGGDYRQYYGNLQFVVDWSDSARGFYESNKTSNLLNEEYWFKEGITYSAITSRGTGFRYLPAGCIFDKGGPSINVTDNVEEIIALLNSNVAKYYFWVFNPSINLQVKDIKNFPIKLTHNQSVIEMAKENIEICKADWDSVETSWDFKRHPLIQFKGTIEENFKKWESLCEERFEKLKENEIALNNIYINLYGLNGAISEDVEDRDVTVRKADLQKDIRSLISYAVGCMFGRYSLDAEGIVYAGGEWNITNYKTFCPDEDNIIPICDEDYMSDDIVGRFIEFIEKAYGKDNLEVNLKYITDVLGGNGTPREILRSYFLNDFYKDHCNMYSVTGSGKRPIYWLFDSGKKNGFKCLIYMHRYQVDTLARVRTDYIHELQSRYTTAIDDIERILNTAEAKERLKLNKKLTHLKEQETELRVYEERVHLLADQMIELNLDDGVKMNYAKFEKVLASI